MRCNQCGKEIQENSVFCPFCGVPQKVTADYDYIQSEIGANVDKIKNTGDTVEIPQSGKGNTNAVPSDNRRDDLMKTRNIYGKDTIYDDEPQRNSGRNQNRYDDRYDDYDDGYDDGYDDYDDYERRPAPRRRRREVDDDYFYNNFDDLDDYEKEGGGNKGIIITTIIIVIIRILGVAAIIHFGLKPQDNTETQEVTTEAAADAETTTADGNSDTTTAEETTTAAEAKITESQAKEAVLNYLVEDGIMSSDYSTSDGGFVDLTVATVTEIDGVTYYIIQADRYDDSNNLSLTAFYGVDSATGDLYKVEQDGSTYTIV